MEELRKFTASDVRELIRIRQTESSHKINEFLNRQFSILEKAIECNRNIKSLRIKLDESLNDFHLEIAKNLKI